jgi:hypothetical protein
MNQPCLTSTGSQSLGQVSEPVAFFWSAWHVQNLNLVVNFQGALKGNLLKQILGSRLLSDIFHDYPVREKYLPIFAKASNADTIKP